MRSEVCFEVSVPRYCVFSVSEFSAIVWQIKFGFLLTTLSKHREGVEGSSLVLFHFLLLPISNQVCKITCLERAFVDYLRCLICTRCYISHYTYAQCNLHSKQRLIT